MNDPLFFLRVATEFLGSYFQSSRLIHGSGIDHISRHFLNRHRLPCNGCLFHKRATAKHDAIDGNMSTRFHDHRIADSNLVSSDLHHLSIAPDRDRSGKEIEKVLDGTSPSPNSETLEHLGGKHEGL